MLQNIYATFNGLSVNESTVYCHIPEKLEFTLTRTQAIAMSQNFEGTQEQREQLVEYINEKKIDLKRK